MMGAVATAWGAANAVALALLAWVLWQWSRVRFDVRRPAMAAAAGVLLVAAAMLAVFHWTALPVGWITILQEGRTVRNIQQIYGQAAHSGPGFWFLIDWLSGHGVTTLPAVAALNVTLWLINTVIFFFLARPVLGAWWASLAFTITYAANLNTLHAAVSETPAMLWNVYFWLGCVAGAALDDDAHLGAAMRGAALLCLTLLAGLAATLRTELLLIGAPAVAIGLVRVGGMEAGVRNAGRTVVVWLCGLAAGPLWALLAVIAILLLIDRLPLPLQARWLLAGLQPINPSFLNMPWALGVFLPLAVITLFVLGLIHALRRCVSFCLLPVTALILFKVYASASHGALFEMFRYLTFLTPVVLFIALFGFRELSAWAQRRAWPWWWRRLALVVLALTFTIWNPPGTIKELFGRGQQLPGLTPLPRALTTVSAPLLAWNQQTEVRYLLDLIERYPDCVLIIKGTQADAAFQGDRGYRWTALGRSVAHYSDLLDDGRGVEQVAAELAPGAACVLFYRSLDCNLIDADGCRAEIAGRQPLEERVMENLPYNDLKEYGAYRAEIHLGVYPIVPPNAAAHSGRSR